MAIIVTKRRTPLENYIFDATCVRCKSELQFQRRDGEVTSDQRDGDFVTVKCPVCGTPVHAALSKGREPSP